MDVNIITTIISTGGAVIVGLGGMWFSAHQLGRRMDDLVATVNGRFTSVERRLELIESDLKDFFKTQAEQDKRITRLEDRGK